MKKNRQKQLTDYVYKKCNEALEMKSSCRFCFLGIYIRNLYDLGVLTYEEYVFMHKKAEQRLKWFSKTLQGLQNQREENEFTASGVGQTFNPD